jgi:hypothetical protein
LILGNVKEVTKQVLDYRRMFGDRLHFVLRLNYPGQDPARSDRATELWGQVAQSVRDELWRMART